MMRKESPKYLPILVPLILKMMTDLDDDDDWSVMDEISEDDSDSNNVVAESALDRLACSLGGKTMFPQIAQNIPEMMKHPDWKYRLVATCHGFMIYSKNVCCKVVRVGKVKNGGRENEGNAITPVAW